MGSLHHSSSIRHVSRTASIVTGSRTSLFRTPHSALRIPILAGDPQASSSTTAGWGTFTARNLSAPFRIPNSAFRIFSGFKVDQRVPPLGETRPWLHLDDVIQHRPFDPQRDLPGGALERTPPPGASRGARITREQLQLRGTRCESGELDDQPLHRSGGRRTL